jgi:large subunit ribosomal protein L13
MRTVSVRAEDVHREWWLIDAEGLTLGRLCTEIARRLRGKHKPTYTPHSDTGDFIVIVNAEKVAVTGNKANDKLYYRHSGRPGGLKTATFREVIAKQPGRIIETAVKGMLPHNSLGRQLFRKLKVYSGPDHPHAAQQPQFLSTDA